MSRSPIAVTGGVYKGKRIPVSVSAPVGKARPPRKPRLTANEKKYYEAILAVLASIPRSVIREQFEKPIGSPAVFQIIEHMERVEPFLNDLTLFQLDQSGALMFNEIKRAVAADWKTLEKATPSQTALDMKFNRASPNATAYASMSAGNMVRDITRSQMLAVSRVIETAFNEGLTRPQTSQALYRLLNKIPTPSGSVAGNYAVGQIFGDATRGLTVRYADAVVNRATKIMADNPNLSAVQLKKKVDAYGSRLRRSRARMIARTELMRASNQGRLQGMWQAADQGLVNPTLAKKQWVTSSFDVCPICIPLNGKTVGIRDSFGPPGQAPPAHPNCKCTVRMLPDPMTFGSPTSIGTGQTGSPMQLIRPQRPGLKIQDLDEAASGAGVVAAPDELIGEPGAPDELLDGDDIDLPLPTEPVGRVEAMQSEEYFLDNAETLVEDANRLGRAGQDELLSKRYSDGDGWFYGDGSDYGMSVIAREQGFDGLPAVVDEAQMARLQYADLDPDIPLKSHPVFYRGIGADTAQELDGFVDDFLRNADNPYQGHGIYGSGTYVTDDLETAIYYSKNKAGVSTRGADPSNKEWSNSKVLKMALDPDAKVVDSDELHDLMTAADNRYRDILQKSESDISDIIKNYEEFTGDVLMGTGKHGGKGGYGSKTLWDPTAKYALGEDVGAKLDDLVDAGKLRFKNIELSRMTKAEIDEVFNEDVIGFKLDPGNKIPVPDTRPEAEAKLIDDIFGGKDSGRYKPGEENFEERIGWNTESLVDDIPDSIDAPTGAGTYREVLQKQNDAKWQQRLLQDDGRYAASQGYDAIRKIDPNPTGMEVLDLEYWVILNRTALSVLDPTAIVL